MFDIRRTSSPVPLHLDSRTCFCGKLFVNRSRTQGQGQSFKQCHINFNGDYNRIATLYGDAWWHTPKI